jgi:hypothetical protein
VRNPLPAACISMSRRKRCMKRCFSMRRGTLSAPARRTHAIQGPPADLHHDCYYSNQLGCFGSIIGVDHRDHSPDRDNPVLQLVAVPVALLQRPLANGKRKSTTGSASGNCVVRHARYHAETQAITADANRDGGNTTFPPRTLSSSSCGCPWLGAVALTARESAAPTKSLVSQEHG